METLIIVAIWIWGAYKGWGFLAGKVEWLDRKEPVNLIVKGSICIVLGALFGLLAIFKFGWQIVSFVLRHV